MRAGITQWDVFPAGLALFPDMSPYIRVHFFYPGVTLDRLLGALPIWWAQMASSLDPGWRVFSVILTPGCALVSNIPSESLTLTLPASLDFPAFTPSDCTWEGRRGQN